MVLRSLRQIRIPLPGWPGDCAPDESWVLARNERTIHVDATTLWDLLTDADQWPGWYGNARRVKVLDGPRLQLGTYFQWITFGLPIDSVVTTFQKPRQLGWLWQSRGWTGAAWGYHGWRLTPGSDGTSVVTEEAQRGLLPWSLRSILTPALCTGHALWLYDLDHRARAR